MAQAHILLNSWSLDAIATSTNEDPDIRARASALLNYSPSRRWKTNNLTAMQAILDAGSPKPWDTLFLGFSNATAAATLRITSDDNSGVLFTSPAYDSTPFTLRLPANGDFISWTALHQAPNTQTYQYIGIEVSDGANPDGYFTAGVAYVGNLFTPSLHASLGASDGHEDLSIPIRLSNGETRVRRRVRKGGQGFQWEHLNETDTMFFRNLFRVYGKSTPVVVWRDPEETGNEHNLINYGYLDYPRKPVKEQKPYGYHSVSMDIDDI